MTTLDPALVLVVSPTCYSVFRALVPLATTWYFWSVAEHAHENNLFIWRELQRIFHMNLTKVIVTVYLDFYSIDDILPSTNRCHDTFYKGGNSCKTFNIFIRTALNPLGEVSKIVQFWVEASFLGWLSIDSWIGRQMKTAK